MKKLIVLAVATLVAVCMAVPAFAVESKVGKGSSELSAFANITGTTSSVDGKETSKSTTTMVQLGYAYFLTDAFSLGASILGVGNSTTPTGGDTTSTTVTYVQLDGKFHFYSKGQTVIPYVGLSVGATAISSQSKGFTDSASGSMVAGRGGLKFFVSETTSLNLELAVDQYSYQFAGSSTTTTNQDTIFSVGFSTYF